MEREIIYTTVGNEPTIDDAAAVTDGVPIEDYLEHNDIIIIVDTPDYVKRYRVLLAGNNIIFDDYLGEQDEIEEIGEDEV